MIQDTVTYCEVCSWFPYKKMCLTFPQWSVELRASFLSNISKNMCNFPFNRLNRLNSKCLQCSLYHECACKSQNVRSCVCVSSGKQHFKHLHGEMSWQNCFISPTCLKCRICLLCVHLQYTVCHLKTHTLANGQEEQGIEGNSAFNGRNAVFPSCRLPLWGQSHI